MSDSENEQGREKIILHTGEDIKKYSYERRIQFEEVFRLNHLDDIQELYEDIRECFEADPNGPIMNNLQDFIDFCMENSYMEECKYTNDNYSDEEIS